MSYLGFVPPWRASLMPFDQLPISRSVASLPVVGADIGSAAIKPRPQAGSLAVNIQVLGYADPLAAGPCAAIVQTRKAGSNSWFRLTSSRENEINASGSYSILVVDPILDDVRVLFDVDGHTFTADCTFLADAPMFPA